MTIIKIADTDQEIEGILGLQQANLPSQLNPQEQIQEGFVTIRHTFELLKRMNQDGGHIIVKDHDQVKAYALYLHPAMMPKVEFLGETYKFLQAFEWNGKKAIDHNFVFMGQICVDKSLRGQGYFRKLYEAFKQEYGKNFEWCFTLVALRNQRSLTAHKKIGFETMYTMVDPDAEPWELIGWKMR